MIYKHISLLSIPTGRRKFRVGREYHWCRILHKRFSGMSESRGRISARRLSCNLQEWGKIVPGNFIVQTLL